MTSGKNHSRETGISSSLSGSNIFKPISDYVSRITGVVLGPKQGAQVHARITHRMRSLGIATEREYLEYFELNKSEESEHLVSLLTTHYTFFFREYAHFEYLIEKLPDLIATAKKEGRKKIRVWSAACSTGQEVYSLAMMLTYHLAKIDPSMKFEVLGSDVDPKSVRIAKNGVYRWNELKEVPAMYLAGQWARGTGDISDFVKAKSTIREHMNFEVRNLVDLVPASENDKFDVIFCRNVFIYFSKEQIKKVVEALLPRLNSKGFLVTGLSESLTDLNIPLEHRGRSIYNKISDTIPVAVKSPTESRLSNKVEAEKKLVRVLTVDDSISVLAILNKIFCQENGFKVVGKATNGLKAAEFLKENEVDVVTLDIHMPEQNGVEYLQQNFRSNHPPVIIVSSVRREESDLAIKALNLGAFDYIEKPSLGNLDVIGEEIKAKAHFAAKFADSNVIPKHDIDTQFSRKIYIDNADQKIKHVFASVSDIKKLTYMFKDSISPQPPAIVYFTQPGELLPSLVDQLKAQIRNEVCLLTNPKDVLKANCVYLANIEVFEDVRMAKNELQSVKILFGSFSEQTSKIVNRCLAGNLILEDLGESHSRYYDRMKSRCDYFVPYTSFAYETGRILSQRYLDEEKTA